jgi:hypothetical protein
LIIQSFVAVSKAREAPPTTLFVGSGGNESPLAASIWKPAGRSAVESSRPSPSIDGVSELADGVFESDEPPPHAVATTAETNRRANTRSRLKRDTAAV